VHRRDQGIALIIVFVVGMIGLGAVAVVAGRPRGVIAVVWIAFWAVVGLWPS
jgi:hypothetical protein